VLGEVGHSSRHRLRGAHIVKHDHHSGDLTGSIMNWGCRVFDRRFPPVSAHENTIGRQDERSSFFDLRFQARHDGLARGRIDDLKDFRQLPPNGFLHRPSQQLFCHRIEECDASLSIRAQHGVANGVQRDLRPFLVAKQVPFSRFSRDHCVKQVNQRLGVQTALERIVLSSLLDQVHFLQQIEIVAHNDDR